MKAMRTVKDVMDKVQSIHEASSWINHICVQKAADMTEQCRSGLMMADDLLYLKMREIARLPRGYERIRSYAMSHSSLAALRALLVGPLVNLP